VTDDPGTTRGNTTMSRPVLVLVILACAAAIAAAVDLLLHGDDNRDSGHDDEPSNYYRPFERG
jgi:hypothetical protein